MADIPVEKKGGTPWWVWLLGLLVLIGIIWLLLELFDDEPDDLEDDTDVTTEQVEPNANGQDMNATGAAAAGAAAGGTITSLDAILNASGPQEVVGRQVRLSDMYITSVVGDSTFFVAPTQQGDRAFPVAIDEVIPASPPGTEGRYDVTEGQLMTIMGTVRELSGQESTAWNVQGADRERLENNQFYVRAQQLQITQEAGQ